MAHPHALPVPRDPHPTGHGKFPVARLRAALTFTAALLLSACAATHQPMGPASQTATLARGALLAYDGARLPLRHWDAGPSPRAVVIALHGMNDYAEAFARPADWWATQGITTYAFDQRGFGATDRPGIWPDVPTLAADLEAAITAVTARHPGVPLFVLGESMGGAVAIAGLARAATVPHRGPQIASLSGNAAPPPRIAGLILSAPALWGRQTMNPFFRLTLWAGYHTMPGKYLTPPRGLRIVASDNIEMLRGLGRDPLVLKRTRLDALHGLVDVMTDAYDGLAQLPPNLPVLMMYGQNEQVLNRGSVNEAVRRAREGVIGDHVRLAIYDDGYHLLLRDLCAQTVWTDVLAWVQDPDAALPSGADAARWADSTPVTPTQPPTCAATAPRSAAPGG